MLDKLKTRWGIQNNFQIALIFLVFSIAGYFIVFVRKFEFGLLGITAAHPFWLKLIVWLVLIFPQYYLFLLIFGALFGQFGFFWPFAKKSFGRFNPKNWKRKQSET